MDKLGIKATIYDLLGYIIPGFLTLLFIYIFMFDKDLNWLLSLKTEKISTPFYALVFVLAYVAGQTISSMSSFLFEGIITKKIFKKYIVNDYSSHNTKTNMLFGKDYKDVDSQNLSSYCQEKFPKVYDTAFVFMTIYGLSRNVATSFLILTVYVINKFRFFSVECLITVLSMILLIRNYYRFKKYFELKINSALYL